MDNPRKTSAAMTEMNIVMEITRKTSRSTELLMEEMVSYIESLMLETSSSEYELGTSFPQRDEMAGILSTLPNAMKMSTTVVRTEVRIGQLKVGIFCLALEAPERIASPICPAA